MINVISRLLPVILLATTHLNFSLGLILTALVQDLVVQNQKPHMLKLLEQSLKRRQTKTMNSRLLNTVVIFQLHYYTYQVSCLMFQIC